MHNPVSSPTHTNLHQKQGETVEAETLLPTKGQYDRENLLGKTITYHQDNAPIIPDLFKRALNAPHQPLSPSRQATNSTPGFLTPAPEDKFAAQNLFPLSAPPQINRHPLFKDDDDIRSPLKKPKLTLHDDDSDSDDDFEIEGVSLLHTGVDLNMASLSQYFSNPRRGSMPTTLLNPEPFGYVNSNLRPESTLTPDEARRSIDEHVREIEQAIIDINFGQYYTIADEEVPTLGTTPKAPVPGVLNDFSKKINNLKSLITRYQNARLIGPQDDQLKSLLETLCNTMQPHLITYRTRQIEKIKGEKILLSNNSDNLNDDEEIDYRASSLDSDLASAELHLLNLLNENQKDQYKEVLFDLRDLLNVGNSSRTRDVASKHEIDMWKFFYNKIYLPFFSKENQQHTTSTGGAPQRNVRRPIFDQDNI